MGSTQKKSGSGSLVGTLLGVFVSPSSAASSTCVEPTIAWRNSRASRCQGPGDFFGARPKKLPLLLSLGVGHPLGPPGSSFAAGLPEIRPAAKLTPPHGGDKNSREAKKTPNLVFVIRTSDVIIRLALRACGAASEIEFGCHWRRPASDSGPASASLIPHAAGFMPRA